MAEIKFPSPSIWEEFKLKTKLIDPPVVRLQLKPLLRKGQIEGLIVFAGIPDIDQLLGVAQKKRGGKKTLKSSGSEISRLWPVFEKIVPVVMRHVIGWDLTLDGEPIPCTDEEKAKWLEPLMWEEVEGRVEQDEPAAAITLDPGDEEAKDNPKKKKELKFLWAELMGIIRDHGNFRKN